MTSKQRTVPFGSSSTRTALLAALSLLSLLSGCGGGALSLTGPTVESPTITTVPTPLTAAGGTATVQVQITGNSVLNTTSNPPQIDVKDTAGVSLLGGPKPLVSLNGSPNAWAFQFTVPANATASTVVYQATITAQSISGSTGNTPFNAGGIIVPPR